MKTIISILSIITIILQANSALAFNSFGKINEYLQYDDIKIINDSNPKVCGKASNKSKKVVYIFSDILFKSRSELLNKATYHVKLHPGSQDNFCVYLNKKNYKDTKDALFLEWDVYMLEVDGKQLFFNSSIY